MHKEHNEVMPQKALIEDIADLISVIKKKSVVYYEQREIYLVINDIFDPKGPGTPFDRLLAVIVIDEDDDGLKIIETKLETISSTFGTLDEKKRITLMIRAVERFPEKR